MTSENEEYFELKPVEITSIQKKILLTALEALEDIFSASLNEEGVSIPKPLISNVKDLRGKFLALEFKKEFPHCCAVHLIESFGEENGFKELK